MSEENNTFILYKVAKQLVENDSFQVLLIDQASDEVWLEKRIGKRTQIVRFLPRDFHWKNHLKQDIAKVFQAIQAAKKLLANKQIDVHNVYIATKTPLDDWEILKKPMQLQDKQAIMMHVYYMDMNEGGKELQRLQTNLHISHLEMAADLPDNQLQLIHQWKAALVADLQQRENAEKNLFDFGKPILTYLFMAVNILMFLFMEINGGSQSTENLIRFGAKENISIIDGDWWRLLTSMFLHIGFVHLFMNMVVLYYLGSLVEKMFGSIRFFVIYFVAGVGGAIASFAFNMNVSAGASGAIFGLFGALICFGMYHRHVFLRTMGQNVLVLLLINLVYGFFVSGVDVQAHLGGLAGGFLAAMIVQLPKVKKYTHQIIAFILTVVLLVAFCFYGVHQTKHSAIYEWEQVNAFMNEQNYKDVIKHATEGIEKAPEPLKAALLFKRAYAYTATDQTNKAIADYENSIQADPDIAESYYNLALLYMDKNELKKAEIAAKKAHRLVPENKDFKNLHNQIKNGERP